ncbi:hypothetical protein [Ensifer aridi]|nr:hypothetical protein [Ensifer aridi]
MWNASARIVVAGRVGERDDEMQPRPSAAQSSFTLSASLSWQAKGLAG